MPAKKTAAPAKKATAKKTTKKETVTEAPQGRAPAPWEAGGMANPANVVPPPAPPQVPTAAPVAAAAFNLEVAKDPAWLGKLWSWTELVNRVNTEVKPLIELEREQRRELTDAFFPMEGRLEGTTNLPLPEGWVLKLVQQYDRTFDEPAMGAVFAKLPEGSDKTLIKWVPTLVTAEFRKLPQDQRIILEQCLVTKPKSVTLDLVAPKPPKE